MLQRIYESQGSLGCVFPMSPSRLESVAISHQRPVHSQWFRLTDGESATLHGEEQVDICIVTEGTAIHHGASAAPLAPQGLGKERRIGPGSVVIAGPGRGHGFEQPRGMTMLAVSFLAEWLLDDLRASWGDQGLLPPFWAAVIFRRSHAARLPHFTLTPETLQMVTREADDLAHPQSGPAPPRLYLKATLLKLMALLGEAHAREPHAEDPATAFSLPVTRVLDEIEQSLAEGQPFRVTNAAASAAMTSDHLARLFHEATGETPRAYYQRRRAQVAAALLLDPARSITGIAGQLGFCDAAHFCNAFKRIHGQSPSAYRKHYHGG